MVEQSFSGAFPGPHEPLLQRLRGPVATEKVTVLIACSGRAEKRILLPAGAYVPLRPVGLRDLAEVVATRLAEDAPAPKARAALLALSSILASLRSSGPERTCAVGRDLRAR